MLKAFVKNIQYISKQLNAVKPILKFDDKNKCD
jgi:hypothetical protein